MRSIGTDEKEKIFEIDENLKKIFSAEIEGRRNRVKHSLSEILQTACMIEYLSSIDDKYRNELLGEPSIELLLTVKYRIYYSYALDWIIIYRDVLEACKLGPDNLHYPELLPEYSDAKNIMEILPRILRVDKYSKIEDFGKDWTYGIMVYIMYILTSCKNVITSTKISEEFEKIDHTYVSPYDVGEYLRYMMGMGFDIISLYGNGYVFDMGLKYSPIPEINNRTELAVEFIKKNSSTTTIKDIVDNIYSKIYPDKPVSAITETVRRDLKKADNIILVYDAFSGRVSYKYDETKESVPAESKGTVEKLCDSCDGENKMDIIEKKMDVSGEQITEDRGMAIPKEGEIWECGNGRMYYILKNHPSGKSSTVFFMTTEENEPGFEPTYMVPYRAEIDGIRYLGFATYTRVLVYDDKFFQDSKMKIETKDLNDLYSEIYRLTGVNYSGETMVIEKTVEVPVEKIVEKTVEVPVEKTIEVFKDSHETLDRIKDLELEVKILWKALKTISG